MKTKLQKRFCYTCGHELAQKSRIYAYDEETGKPLFTVDFRCPNARFFTLKQHPRSATEYLGGLY